MCFAVGVAAGFREVSVLYAALQVHSPLESSLVLVNSQVLRGELEVI